MSSAVNRVLCLNDGSPRRIVVVVIDRYEGANDCIVRVAQVDAGALAGVGVGWRLFITDGVI